MIHCVEGNFSRVNLYQKFHKKFIQQNKTLANIQAHIIPEIACVWYVFPIICNPYHVCCHNRSFLLLQTYSILISCGYKLWKWNPLYVSYECCEFPCFKSSKFLANLEPFTNFAKVPTAKAFLYMVSACMQYCTDYCYFDSLNHSTLSKKKTTTILFPGLDGLPLPPPPALGGNSSSLGWGRPLFETMCWKPSNL